VIANVLSPLIDAEQWLLEALHSVGLGWGLAIVGLTLLVRLGTAPLTLRQLHAQRELRGHLPELKRIQKRYKDDRERLQRETTSYYREHGINPLSSFAPMLVQIPVFISLYYVMRSDVKDGLFGHAGFLFIPQLTSKPHGAVLVALLTAYLTSQLASSVIATRTLQGGQRGLALALPLLFVSVVPRFPAGLAVYWVTTSLWSLGQQLFFWRAVPAPAAAAAAPAPAPAEPAPEPPVRGAHPVSKKRKRKKRRRS
jgi:YidC/Oxa1 family membrane protein insertase